MSNKCNWSKLHVCTSFKIISFEFWHFFISSYHPNVTSYFPIFLILFLSQKCVSKYLIWTVLSTILCWLDHLEIFWLLLSMYNNVCIFPKKCITCFKIQSCINLIKSAYKNPPPPKKLFYRKVQAHLMILVSM